MKFIVQRHRFTKRLDLMIGLYNASPLPATHHYHTKGLFIAIPFIKYIMSKPYQKAKNTI